MVLVCKLSWLVVWTPLKNISQLGWLFPIYGKIKNVPQTTNQYHLEYSQIWWFIILPIKVTIAWGMSWWVLDVNFQTQTKQQLRDYIGGNSWPLTTWSSKRPKRPSCESNLRRKIRGRKKNSFQIFQASNLTPKFPMDHDSNISQFPGS